MVVDVSTRDYKKELDGHLEATPTQLLSFPRRSIFSMAKVQQEKIEQEGELQMRERESTVVRRVQEEFRKRQHEERHSSQVHYILSVQRVTQRLQRMGKGSIPGFGSFREE